MRNYTLKPDQVFKGHKELFENDLPKICPYQAPMMVQTQLSPSPVPMFKGCGTWCAMFALHTNDKGEIYAWLNCSPSPDSVCKVKIEEEKTGLKLI